MVSRSFAAVALAAAALSGCGKVRPEQLGVGGLQLSIESAAVNPQTRAVEVVYRVTNGVGVARDRTGLRNRWTLATLTQDAINVPQYQSLVLTGPQSVVLQGPGGPTTLLQPGFEEETAQTAVADLGDGRFRYTFTTPLPEGFNPGATFRVGVFSQLQTNPGQTPARIDQDQPNVVHDFVPNGGAPQSRELVDERACNVCHSEVRAHGGFRRGVKICTTCHTTQLFDPDTVDPALLDPTITKAPTATEPTPPPANPLDLGRLVHRIHRGKQLQTLVNVENAARGCPTPTTTVGCPTPPPPAPAQEAAIAAAGPLAAYSVVGFGDTVFTFGRTQVRTENNVPTLVRSGVNLPPPNDVRNCTLCHQQAKDAAQHLTTVQRRICTACHADVWFNSPTPPDAFHVVHTTDAGPFPISDDRTCNGCHSQSNAPVGVPLSQLEFGRFVDGAHTVPIRSQQLAGLTGSIESVTNTAPGQRPTIVFKILNGNGTPVTSLASPSLSSLRATLNGPSAPDYANLPQQEDLVPGSTFDAATGSWTHAFTTATIPANATGTWAIGLEGRRNVPLPNRDELPSTPPATVTVTEGMVNPIAYFDVAGGAAQPRRMAVSQQKCDACHLALQIHGNQRDAVEYCVLCHNPVNTDWSRRPGITTPLTPTSQVNVAGTVDNQEETTIHLKPLIHRIHMGNALELSKPYAVYGFGSRPIFFDESGLPEAAKARCDKCHDGDSFTLEAMPPGRLPTVANETATVVHAGTNFPVAGEPSVPPMSSACLSCHDTQTAVTHAAAYVTPGGELCLDCHGNGRVRAVRDVHPIGGD